MSFLRRLPTTRLLALIAVVSTAVIAAGAIAVAASGGGGATPEPKPLAQALHDAAAAPAPDGVTASVSFTNNLFPSGALTGNVSSALISGAHGRLWATADGHGRIELQSDAGDTQIVWSPTAVTAFDASSNTVYRYAHAASTDPAGAKPLPTVDEITKALEQLSAHANVSTAEPDNVGGQPAYRVTVSPKQNGGLVGDAQLAWAAANGVPLSIGVTAKGGSSPVLELKVTDISFGAVASNDVDVAPPAGAKIVDLGAATDKGAAPQDKPVVGLDAVRAAVPFALVAPADANGQMLTSARLVGEGALLVYGEGLGSLVVHESAAKGGSSSSSSMLGALPKVSLGNGVSASELQTPIGNVLTFERNGVAFVVGGSLTAPDAEAAARAFTG